MKLDDTLKRIMEQVVVEVKEKFGITFTIEDIYNVIDSQIEATKIGFVKGISIHWIRFGKFLFTEQSKRKKEVRNYIADIDDENTNLTQAEKEQRKKVFIVLKAEEKKRVTEEQKSQKITHSLNYIKNTEDSNNPSKLPILQLITKPKIEEEDGT